MPIPDDDAVDPFDPDLLEPGESAVVSVSGSGSQRRAVLRPSSAGRLATLEQHQVLHDLQEVSVIVAEQQGVLRAFVAQARDLGISWSLIGWCVGLTAEGARTRYDPQARAPRSSKPSRRRS